MPFLSDLFLVVGVGQVIKGWDKGIEGMCVGEKRKLTIPSSQAYGPRHIRSPSCTLAYSSYTGSRGAGGVIPPDAALVFTTELVGLEAGHSEL